MAIEIERKFVVIDEGWRDGAVSHRHIRQAYLSNGDRLSVRVRIDGASKAALTIKTVTPNLQRTEFEYPVPVRDAEELLMHCQGGVITKVRYIVPIGAFIFEIDVFGGENLGLVVAEIELDRPDRLFERPPWLGAEVTDDRRYYNAGLAQHPFSSW